MKNKVPQNFAEARGLVVGLFLASGLLLAQPTESRSKPFEYPPASPWAAVGLSTGPSDGIGLAIYRHHTRQASGQIRLTPPEIAGIPSIGAGAGTSGVSGIETRVLKGDPSKAGLYTIELIVPAHTRIQAHTHPDDRVATVVSGTWNFGYGTQFDPAKLKPLPPGSFYTEPANAPHFAMTGETAVRVHISGFGPTGTHYVESDRTAGIGQPSPNHASPISQA